MKKIVVIITLLILFYIIVDQVIANLEARIRMRHFKELKLAHAVSNAIRIDSNLIPSTMGPNHPVKINQLPPPFKDAKEYESYFLIWTSKGLVFYRGEPDSSYYINRLENTSNLEQSLNFSYDLSVGTTTDTWKMVIISKPAIENPLSTTSKGKVSLPGLWRYDDSAFN